MLPDVSGHARMRAKAKGFLLMRNLRACAAVGEASGLTGMLVSGAGLAPSLTRKPLKHTFTEGAQEAARLPQEADTCC